MSEQEPIEDVIERNDRPTASAICAERGCCLPFKPTDRDRLIEEIERLNLEALGLSDELDTDIALHEMEIDKKSKEIERLRDALIQVRLLPETDYTDDDLIGISDKALAEKKKLEKP